MTDLRHPADWSIFARALLLTTVFMLVLLLGWQSYLQPTLARLATRAQKERELKIAYHAKIAQAPDPARLQQQLQGVRDAAQMLQQQLSQADDDTTLAVIARAAQAHGLTLESVRPGQSESGKRYATQALVIRLNGSYHAFGGFAADIAAARPIVLLSDLQLAAAGDGIVTIDAVAQSLLRNRDQVDGAPQQQSLAPARAAP